MNLRGPKRGGGENIEEMNFCKQGNMSLLIISTLGKEFNCITVL